jgi:hypothetical protein
MRRNVGGNGCGRHLFASALHLSLSEQLSKEVKKYLHMDNPS